MTNLALPLICLALFALPSAHSQSPAPPAPVGPITPVAPGAPIAPNDRRHADSRVIIRSGGEDPGSMGILPLGTWWKNPNTVALLALTPDQQKRMDDIFRQSRIQLIDVKASLEKEQLNLEPVLNTNPLDSDKALAEISKIADLRADLEKANARMLLRLRSVLSADQWTKLQSDRHGHGPMSPMEYFRGGRHGSMGPLALLDPNGFNDFGIELAQRLADLQVKLPPMNIHIPELHIPKFDVPPVTIPEITIPEINVPARLPSPTT